VVSVRNIVEARRTAEAERALAESARNDAANKGAEVTARLRASYLDRARVELAAHHMDRALALLSEAAALGVDTPAVRLAVARALDELPATWRHLGAVTSVRMVPGTHDVVFTES